MKEVLKETLSFLEENGATYADIRFVRERTEDIAIKNGAIESLADSSSSGVGIRVLYKGSWGHAGTNKLDLGSIIKAAEKALRLARAASRVKVLDVVLSNTPVVKDSYTTPVEKNPFNVPLEEKIALLLRCDEIMSKEPEVLVRKGNFSAFETEKDFYSTEGSEIYQKIIWCGAGIAAIAVRGTENQVRSYPASFGGDFACRGYEFVESLNLEKHAAKIAKEAVSLLSAPQCPRKKTTFLLGGSQLALQIHESCGHPVELDRALGMEASFAGTSFLTPDKRNNFKYGSEIVNIYGDATHPGALGSFKYDDEGVPAKKFDIIKDGVFVNYLTSRETSILIDEESNGTVRADGWERFPLIRMTNLSLKPDDWKLDELIKDTDSGVMFNTNRSWSIDQQRLNFQFGCEIAYKIEDGSIEGIYKNPTYTGITPEFWGSCDAITNSDDWRMWGIPNCGKGEPMQIMYVGHGCSTARFNNVQIGIGKF